MGLRILNGRLGDDRKVGRYTCINTNGTSVVDYVLCKPELFKLIQSFNVAEPNILSDHCVIYFSLNMISNTKPVVANNDTEKIDYI